nr:DUF4395 domain-containing protein [Actinotalea ferrariae]
MDPRGPRFGAAVTAALLALTILLAGSPAATVLLAGVVVLFVVGVARGAQGSVQGVLYRRLVRPRLAPPRHLEDPAPPRFAQLVGLLVTGTGLVLALAGVPGAVLVAAAVAFVAAFLNAAFGLCLGCEMYVLLRRLRPSAG